VNHIKTDVLVIGAGSGGLAFAAGASQMGAGVVLLEGHRMGGDCLNYGCVPSKALLASARAAHAQAHSAAFGIADVAPRIDYGASRDHVGDIIAQIEPMDSQARFEGFGVRVIREYGRFISPTKVQAGETIITARRFVIATGSSPLVPPIPGLDRVPFETNETLIGMRARPAHLLIIGGGPVGMEMAQAHIRLGSRVTVIEGARVLGRDDPELAAIVLDSLREEGVEIAEDALAAEIRGRAGAIEIEARDGRVFTGTHLLLAAGRKANVDRLDLATAGIETSRTGIRVNAGLRSSNRRVYAIGDVTGGMQFTHVAGYQAGVIIRSILLGLPSRASTAHIPWASYTDPELAQIGLNEADARTVHGDRLKIARFDFAHNDRAIAERRTKGLIKVMVVRGRPVGVSIVGHQAGELISLWSLVLANNLKMRQVAAMVSPYPTIGEVNKRVAGAYFALGLFDNPMVKHVVRMVQRLLP
jgi:pyruvate/2-oxoglutarate dehydrogenase complex dihydrolipoamide dehydrogenase (E3) component